MAIIKIRSRLDHFRLIEAIFRVDDVGIGGVSRFDRAFAFAGLEAMAQLAALHVRHRIGFKRHAFLLKVIHCRLMSGHPLDGKYMLNAQLTSHSLNAFRYEAVAVQNQNRSMDCELLIGVKDYDRSFSRNHLQGHYQKMFDRLHGAVPRVD